MADVRPFRLQFSRRKGFDLQAISRAANGLPAKVVTRQTKHGNPFKIEGGDDYWTVRDIRDEVGGYSAFVSERTARDHSVRLFAFEAKQRAIEIRATLAGFNLACTCPLTFPDGSVCACHADVLLEIANPPSGGGMQS